MLVADVIWLIDTINFESVREQAGPVAKDTILIVTSPHCALSPSCWMTSSADENEIVRHYEMLRGTERPGYETLGRFEVPDAQRIMDRLDEEHIPFEVDAPYEIRPMAVPYRQRHLLYIYVRPEFKKRADEILLEGFQL